MNIENIQHLKELHDEIKNHPYRSSFDKSLGYDFRRKILRKSSERTMPLSSNSSQ